MLKKTHIIVKPNTFITPFGIKKNISSKHFKWPSVFYTAKENVWLSFTYFLALYDSMHCQYKFFYR